MMKSLICPWVVCLTLISRCSATWTLFSGRETSGSCSRRLAGIRVEWHDTQHQLQKNTPPPSTSSPTTSKTTTRAPSTNREQASEEPAASANQTTARWGVTLQVDPRPTDHTTFYLPITRELITGRQLEGPIKFSYFRILRWYAMMILTKIQWWQLGFLFFIL